MSDDVERCYTAGLRILNYRFNSEAELRAKLDRKEFPRDAIDAAIERLRREKWLDDARFAEAFVRARVAKRQGKVRIRGELRAAGVDDETAGAALKRILNPDVETEALRLVCEKRIGDLRRRHGAEYLITDKARSSLAAYLLRQGYERSQVFDVIRRLTASC